MQALATIAGQEDKPARQIVSEGRTIGCKLALSARSERGGMVSSFHQRYALGEFRLVNVRDELPDPGGTDHICV
ncbi:MAG: hypothetical protein MK060_19465 [Blastomonas sp.]|uniref:hypothetical protein n=1 Tax=Blastomonas sp. TaxID=1909299 RepID=UPI003BCF645D|nr:hypothetical protein [Blastomonas sp.]